MCLAANLEQRTTDALTFYTGCWQALLQMRRDTLRQPDGTFNTNGDYMPGQALEAPTRKPLAVYPVTAGQVPANKAPSCTHALQCCLPPGCFNQTAATAYPYPSTLHTG
jgi:hypothetical protein